MLITDSNACIFWSSFWLITFGFDFIYFLDNFSFHWGISVSHSSQRFNWMFALVSMFLSELPNINHVWMVQCMKWFHKRCGIYEFCSCNLLLTHSRLSVKCFLVGVGWNVKSIGPRETITWQIVILFTELHPLYCTVFCFCFFSPIPVIICYIIYVLSYHVISWHWQWDHLSMLHKFRYFQMNSCSASLKSVCQLSWQTC